MNQADEFYIGWQGQAPVGIGWHVRKTVVALLVLLLVLAGISRFNAANDRRGSV